MAAKLPRARRVGKGHRNAMSTTPRILVMRIVIVVALFVHDAVGIAAQHPMPANQPTFHAAVAPEHGQTPIELAARPVEAASFAAAERQVRGVTVDGLVGRVDAAPPEGFG